MRKIFGKLRRSNSGNLEDLGNDSEFTRGGVRATAGPRLGWSQSNSKRSSLSFEAWDIDALCAWFDEMGMNNCEEDLRKWVKSGAELAKASPVDIEKELNLKSPLHRKKIVLAIADLSGQEKDNAIKNAGKLDCSWVTLIKRIFLIH